MTPSRGLKHHARGHSSIRQHKHLTTTESLFRHTFRTSMGPKFGGSRRCCPLGAKGISAAPMSSRRGAFGGGHQGAPCAGYTALNSGREAQQFSSGTKFFLKALAGHLGIGFSLGKLHHLAFEKVQGNDLPRLEIRCRSRMSPDDLSGQVSRCAQVSLTCSRPFGSRFPLRSDRWRTSPRRLPCLAWS